VEQLQRIREGPCSPISVPIEGADLDRLLGRTVTGDTISSGYVRVRGIWTGSAIAVESIEAATSDPWLSDLPCPEPAAGWLYPASQGAFRKALTPLAAEITANPDVYGRYWTTPPLNPTNDAGPAVEMAVTKVDPERLRARVESLFPYGACLIEGEFTAAQLTAAEALLTRADGTWLPAWTGITPRVAIRLAMLDESAVATFAEHPEAFPEPLVVGVR
jgi:hypothetical protein